MKKILILIIPLFLIFCGCTKVSDGEKFKNEYESLNEKEVGDNKYLSMNIDENNIISYASIEEIIDIIKNGTGVIYLGFPECPWCRNAVPNLLDAADSTSLDKIYYLNMKEVRDILSLDDEGKVVTESNGDSKYKELLTALDSILDEYVLTDKMGNSVDTGEKRIYVPMVLFIKNGEVVFYHNDTVESQTDPYIPLTEDEKNELVSIYKNGISKVIDSNYCDTSTKGKC